MRSHLDLSAESPLGLQSSGMFLGSFELAPHRTRGEESHSKSSGALTTIIRGKNPRFSCELYRNLLDQMLSLRGMDELKKDKCLGTGDLAAIKLTSPASG